MRTFKHFPQDKTCPICKTNNDFPCFLMPVSGTSDGSICQAKPVHRGCIGDEFIKSLVISKDSDVIYYVVERYLEGNEIP